MYYSFFFTADDVVPNEMRHIGCFLDDVVRALNGTLTLSGSRTVENCLLECRGNGYEYAGLQAVSKRHEEDTSYCVVKICDMLG